MNTMDMAAYMGCFCDDCPCAMAAQVRFQVFHVRWLREAFMAALSGNSNQGGQNQTAQALEGMCPFFAARDCMDSHSSCRAMEASMEGSLVTIPAGIDNMTTACENAGFSMSYECGNAATDNTAPQQISIIALSVAAAVAFFQ